MQGKQRATLITLFLISLVIQGYSCEKKSSEIAEESPFGIEIHDNVNFPVFTIHGEQDISNIEWIFPNEVKIRNKRTITYYFERKGIYDVTLNYSTKGKTFSHTKQIDITNNSSYFERGEKIWWQEEFEGEALDIISTWQYDIGSNKETNLWGNNEWQEYTSSPKNSFLRDGKLVLKAIKTGAGQKVGDYTSARLTTKGKKEVNRGRIEVKAKLGGGVGLWPAIWLYQSSWSDGYYSELDIMEYVGVDKNIIYSAVHTNTTKKDSKNRVGGNKNLPGVEDEFHVYGVNWADGKVEFYIDDSSRPHLVFVPEDKGNPDDWPFNKKLYLILNIAVGGDWGGMKGVNDAIFPQEMEVEYVRVFQKEE